jgi:hypothetical protein
LRRDIDCIIADEYQAASIESKMDGYIVNQAVGNAESMAMINLNAILASFDCDFSRNCNTLQFPIYDNVRLV